MFCFIIDHTLFGSELSRPFITCERKCTSHCVFFLFFSSLFLQDLCFEHNRTGDDDDDEGVK